MFKFFMEPGSTVGSKSILPPLEIRGALRIHFLFFGPEDFNSELGFLTAVVIEGG